MLRYFHRPLPSRLGVLVLVLVGWRLTGALLAPAPLTLAELRLQLVGERLHDGLHLYRDLYTTLAPLTARVAWLLDVLAGGRSVVAYRLAAMGLLLGQALYFNDLLNRREALPAGRSWLPALLYGLGGAGWFELDTLTPLLVGQTFLLWSFGSLVNTTRVEGYDNRNLFRAGFLLGVAALCHPPLLLFGPVAALAIVFFAANAFRSFLLLVCGVLFPYAALETYYLYTGTLTAFREQHLPWGTLLPFQPVALVSGWQALLVLAVPAGLLVVGMLRSFEQSGGQLNYQVRFRQVMLAWVAGAGLIALADATFSPATLVAWLPPLAYFGPTLMGRGARRWLNDVFFLLAVGALAATRFAGPLGLAPWLPPLPATLLADVPAGVPDPARGLRGQAVLYLGPDLRAYRHNHPATPYLDWDLAQSDFAALTTYQALYNIRQAVRPQRPAWIIDPPRRYLPALRQRLPDTFGAYRQVQPGVWHLNPPPAGSASTRPGSLR